MVATGPTPVFRPLWKFSMYIIAVQVHPLMRHFIGSHVGGGNSLYSYEVVTVMVCRSGTSVTGNIAAIGNIAVAAILIMQLAKL